MNSKKKIREFVLLEKSTPRKKEHEIHCFSECAKSQAENNTHFIY